MPVATGDFYHYVCFQWPWLCQELQGQCKAKPVGSIWTFFNPWGWNLIWCWSNSSWTLWYLIESEIYWMKGNNCCFTDSIQKLFGMQSGIYELTWSCCDDKTPWWYSVGDLDFIQGDRYVRDVKLLCQLSHKVLNWFGWNLVYCSDLDVMNLILSLSRPIVI